MAVIAAAWPATGRHQATLALLGALAHVGWDAGSIEAFLDDVTSEAMGVEGLERGRAGEWQRIAADSVQKADTDTPVVGWPTLAEVIGAQPVERARHLVEPRVKFGTAGSVERATPDGAHQPCGSPVCSVCSLVDGPPPPFPVQALPPVARRLVEEGAASLGCAPDMLATPLLPMVAGVIGYRIQLELKPGYRQRAILWTAVVAEPGTAKTPAQAIVQAPLDILQREAHERHRKALAAYRAELDAWNDKRK